MGFKSLNKLFVHLCLTALTIASAPSLTFANQPVFQTYTIQDGLVSNQVRGLYQDSLGFIWVMTWDGLSRFDGHVFKNYSIGNGLKHNVINDVIAVSAHELYVAENDGTIDVIKNGEVFSDLRMNFEVVNSFYKFENGPIYVTTDYSGICRLTKGIMQPLGNLNEKRSLSRLSRMDSLYFVTGILGSASGILDTEQNYVYQWDMPDVEFYSVFLDTHQRVWFGTSAGLYYLNILGKENWFELRPANEVFKNINLENVIVRVTLETSNGDFWIGTKSGLYRCTPDGSIRLFRQSDGLANDDITDLLEDDQSHLLWVGTAQGISILNLDTEIKVFTIDENQTSNFISALDFNAQGEILFVNDYQTLYKLEKGSTKKILSLNKNEGRLYNFINTGTSILINSSTGLLTLNGEKTSWKFPLDHPSSAFTLFQNGLVFFLTNQIIASCNKVDCAVDSAKYEVMAVTHLPDDRIIIGTWAGGLICGVPNSDGRTFRWEDWSSGLPEKSIRSLFFDRNGNLWVGTRYSGVIQIKIRSNSHEIIDTIDQKDGLISNWVHAIQEDDAGNIWIGTNSGLEKLIPGQEGYSVFPFSRIFSFYHTVNSILMGPDRSLWCATNSGIANIKDGHFERNAPLAAILTSAKIGGEEQLYSGRNLISVPYKKNSASFSFAVPGYLNSRQISYAYRLMGTPDTTWTTTSNTHQIDFANLRSGHYRFEVSALNWNHQQGKIVSKTFSIEPPFWAQLWFIALLILGALLAFYSFYKFRMNQLRRVHEVRQRIASDLHDDIGSSLTHVNILAQIGTTTKSADSDHLFQRIGEEVQSSVEALDDIIWSTQARNDTLEDLIARMQRYGAELFDPLTTKFNISIEALKTDQFIEMELRRDVYLIYKELLGNIAKHAKASEINVQISKQNDKVFLTVIDNGVGFDPALPTNRNGLLNVRQRAEKWSGELQITTQPNLGTTVSVSLRKRPKGTL